MPKKPTPVIERITKRTSVDPETGCHIYQPADPNKPLSTTRALYIKHKGRTVSLLRVVWEQSHPGSKLRADQQVRHKSICKHLHCINPDHLQVTE